MKKRVFFPTLILTFVITGVANAMIVGGLTRENQAQPGQTYTGQIVIKNDANKPQEMKIYQTDYAFDCQGKNFYGSPGELKRSNAGWMTVTPHQFVVPPGQKVAVQYKIKVPQDPNLIGTYWSMIMVQKIPENSPESTIHTSNEEVDLTIRTVVRYGVQIITNIDNNAERKLHFLQTKILKKEKKRILRVDIENTGQYWLRPNLWTELYDESGSYLGKFQARRKRIFPDTSARYEVDLTKVPEGNYKALVVADAGGDYIFGANYNFKFKK